MASSCMRSTASSSSGTSMPATSDVNSMCSSCMALSMSTGLVSPSTRGLHSSTVSAQRKHRLWVALVDVSLTENGTAQVELRSG